MVFVNSPLISKIKMTNQNLKKQEKNQTQMEEIVSLCKRRGFVMPAAEIYGGTGSIWDFGPLGVLLKNNIKLEWWRSIVQTRSDVAGIDGAIITRREVLEASGHESGFSDPLVDCKKCQSRFRFDHLMEGRFGVIQKDDKGQPTCPSCDGELTAPRQFNLMFKTFLGPVEEETSLAYLRPETAQSIFTNFRYIQETARQKLPFGIAQIGKAFRNEITPGNFIFRDREFEQMELEWFCHPEEIANKKSVADSDPNHIKSPDEWYDYWINNRLEWYWNLGIKKENLRLREHDEDELSHYAKAATDIEYNFDFGWSELEGIANRQDFDLKAHQVKSGQDLSYFDEDLKEKFIPHVIEPSVGVDRLMLALLVDAFEKIENKGEMGKKDNIGKREEGEIILHLHPRIAPIKAAILPLVKKDKLPEIAQKIYRELSAICQVDYDESGSIGRRYRRQDEIGTPFCITVDFQSIADETVTFRDRDTMKQERVKIDQINNILAKKLSL